MSNPGGEPTIWCLTPATLSWEDCEMGYAGWLAAMLGGRTTDFYRDLRWPEWVRQVEACRLDQAISVLPPLWTREGKDISAASRRPVPMSEAMSLIGVTQDARRP